MGHTFAEKVLARNAGLAESTAGQIVVVKPDHLLMHDNAAAITAKIAGEIEELGIARPEMPVIILDHVIPARAQLLMMFDISRTLRHVCLWLIEHYGEKLDIVQSVERLKEGMKRVYTRTGSYVSRASNERMRKAQDKWMAMGAPEDLAHRVAVLTLTRAALEDRRP